MSAEHGLQIEHHLDGIASLATMAGEVSEGLRATPKILPSKYFYDEHGSRLFERITDLPEYYLTRAEQLILEDSADRITALSRPRDLVELGPGSAKKTRLLIEAARRTGELHRYIPLEFSREMAEDMARGLVKRYPGLQVHAVVGDFENHLGEIPGGERRVVALLGSTIGNFRRNEAQGLLFDIRDVLESGTDDRRESYLLLGTDLIKDTATLEAAYNDSQGVTAEFNRNILSVINHELDADFDPQAFDHVSYYNPEEERIETYLRSSKNQSARIGALEMEVAFDSGEMLQTEVSCKYSRHSVAALLEEAGLELRHWFTDPEERFALSLSSIR